MIRLVEKSQPDLDDWLVTMWSGYRDELIKAGETPEDADKNVARNKERDFEGDKPAKGTTYLTF